MELIVKCTCLCGNPNPPPKSDGTHRSICSFSTLSRIPSVTMRNCWWFCFCFRQWFSTFFVFRLPFESICKFRTPNTAMKLQCTQSQQCKGMSEDQTYWLCFRVSHTSGNCSNNYTPPKLRVPKSESNSNGNFGTLPGTEAHSESRKGIPWRWPTRWSTDKATGWKRTFGNPNTFERECSPKCNSRWHSCFWTWVSVLHTFLVRFLFGFRIPEQVHWESTSKHRKPSQMYLMHNFWCFVLLRITNANPSHTKWKKCRK